MDVDSRPAHRLRKGCDASADKPWLRLFSGSAVASRQIATSYYCFSVDTNSLDVASKSFSFLTTTLLVIVTTFFTQFFLRKPTTGLLAERAFLSAKTYHTVF